MRRENTKLQEHQFADWDWVKHSQNTCYAYYSSSNGKGIWEHNVLGESLFITTGVLKGLLLGLVSLYTLKIEVYSFSMLCCVVSMCGGKQRREGQKPPLAQDFHGFHWLEVTCTREIGMYSVAI